MDHPVQSLKLIGFERSELDAGRLLGEEDVLFLFYIRLIRIPHFFAAAFLLLVLTPGRGLLPVVADVFVPVVLLLLALLVLSP